MLNTPINNKNTYIRKLIYTNLLIYHLYGYNIPSRLEVFFACSFMSFTCNYKS